MTKRLAVLVALVTIVAGLLLSGNSKASAADTSIPNNVKNQNPVAEEQVSTQDKASATITITMITAPNDGETKSGGE